MLFLEPWFIFIVFLFFVLCYGISSGGYVCYVKTKNYPSSDSGLCHILEQDVAKLTELSVPGELALHTLSERSVIDWKETPVPNT